MLHNHEKKMRVGQDQRIIDKSYSVISVLILPFYQYNLNAKHYFHLLVFSKVITFLNDYLK